jgi:hypothetical protein
MLLRCLDIQVSLSSREALIKLVISAKVEIHSIHAQWGAVSPLSWDDLSRHFLRIDNADSMSLSQAFSLTRLIIVVGQGLQIHCYFNR